MVGKELTHSVYTDKTYLCITSSFARFASLVTCPSFAYVSNPAPDSSLCRAVAPSASAAAPRLCPLQLLLPDCIRFSCCSPIVSASAAAPRLHPLQLLLPDCIRFSCCSPIVSASAAAPRLHLLQLLLPNCIDLLQLLLPQLHPLQLLFPNCVRFSCCSLIASASAAAPRLCPLRLLLPDCIRQLFWNIPAHAQCSRTFMGPDREQNTRDINYCPLCSTRN